MCYEYNESTTRFLDSRFYFINQTHKGHRPMDLKCWFYISEIFQFLELSMGRVLTFSSQIFKVTDCQGNYALVRCYAGLGIRSSVFRTNRSFFDQKLANGRFTQKMSDSLIRSFLVSDLSNSLTIAHFL